ncbi:hypothetical protein NDU88_006530 [Pleurodeles waltl]|uniref:Uncharacterized protein n=1 Tax=Pleurodeles waltl TaxID=8319 RepID=A0AAV7SQ45_PLEWA|nr:hypothetical protein NDU88_006530 [Pleurodeles waltl]
MNSAKYKRPLPLAQMCPLYTGDGDKPAPSSKTSEKNTGSSVRGTWAERGLRVQCSGGGRVRTERAVPSTEAERGLNVQCPVQKKYKPQATQTQEGRDKQLIRYKGSTCITLIQKQQMCTCSRQCRGEFAYEAHTYRGAIARAQ